VPDECLTALPDTGGSTGTGAPSDAPSLKKMEA